METEIKQAIRLVRFGQTEAAIRVLERILNPVVEEEEPAEYPKWVRDDEGREALAKDEEHEKEIVRKWNEPLPVSKPKMAVTASEPKLAVVTKELLSAQKDT